MARELSLVEDIMSGKFNFSSAKEAKALSEGTATTSQKKAKKRKVTLLNIVVVDDYLAMKSSMTNPSIVLAVTPTGTPLAGALAKSSLALSSRSARSKSSESERMLNFSLSSDESAYLDPSFVKEVIDVLLLPADHKTLTSIGPIQSAERSLAHIYQVIKV